MRIISFAKTWPEFIDKSKTATRRFKTVWFDGEHFFPTRPRPARRDEFRKVIIPSWWNHFKGGPTLKPGEVFEGMEWSPRVGPRWCCSACGWIGGKASGMPPSMGSAGKFRCPKCAFWSVAKRLPRRGVLARHVETRIVTLGDDGGCDRCGGTGLGERRATLGLEKFASSITYACAKCGGGGSTEAAREGFPGLSWSQFLAKYFPKVPLDSQVARIHFVRAPILYP